MMLPAKEDDLSKVYRERFASKCNACGHISGDTCKYSGLIVADIKFEVEMYFGLIVPGPIVIMCPVFAELKRGYDEGRRQAPVALALERARRGFGPRTLTSKEGEKR